MVGCLAVSKAGHDKDEIYLIIKEEKGRYNDRGTNQEERCVTESNKEE